MNTDVRPGPCQDLTYRRADAACPARDRCRLLTFPPVTILPVVGFRKDSPAAAASGPDQ